jgi:DNA (cytosine-5)-methyltransferase 1
MNTSTEGRQIKAISLFSGLGGLDIGLHRAGIETVACVEKNKTTAKTLKINSYQHDIHLDEPYLTIQEKYPWTVLNSDIKEIDAETIFNKAGVSKSEIDLVVGGPPCQTFSRSNEGSRSGTGTKRGRLFTEFARLLHQIDPPAFIFENVRGLKSSNEGKDLELIQETLEGDTYQSDYCVLNAADFGVPQTRKRLIIIGTKRDKKPEFPNPTHTEDRCADTHDWVTAGKALVEFDADEQIENQGGYHNAIGSKYGPLLKEIPEGANYQHFSERKYDPEQQEYVKRDESECNEKQFDWRSRHWNYLLKIDRDRPSWTIQAAPGTTVGPFHWRARKLSLLEQMKLMDLPLHYYIAGTPAEIQKQIGNAVPPGFAVAISRKVIKLLGLTTTPVPEPTPNEQEMVIEEQPPFVIKIDTGRSPWSHANRIIHAIHAKEAVVVNASKHAIPYAIDAIEIARRQTEQDLNIDVDEIVVEDKDESGNFTSVLQATIVTAKAAVKLEL